MNAVFYSRFTPLIGKRACRHSKPCVGQYLSLNNCHSLISNTHDGYNYRKTDKIIYSITTLATLKIYTYYVYMNLFWNCFYLIGSVFGSHYYACICEALVHPKNSSTHLKKKRIPHDIDRTNKRWDRSQNCDGVLESYFIFLR